MLCRWKDWKGLLLLHENLFINVPFLWPCQPVWRPAWQCWHLCPLPWSTSRIVAFWRNFSTSRENRNEFSCEKKITTCNLYNTAMSQIFHAHITSRPHWRNCFYFSHRNTSSAWSFFWDGKNSLHTLSTLLSQNSYTHTENLLIANKRASTTLRSSS